MTPAGANSSITMVLISLGVLWIAELRAGPRAFRSLLPDSVAHSEKRVKSPAHDSTGPHHSRLVNQIIAFQVEESPRRPKPLLEIGNKFLGTGRISQGWKLPTGAVWQPSFVAWGTLRSAIQSRGSEQETRSEWANRLDLFGNLYLTFTERIVVGLRPLDYGGQFTGYTFSDTDSLIEQGWQEALNFKIQTLFFEGDLGELFPFLDKSDKKRWDYGFAIGRQQIQYQDGMLINDNIDAVGISRINIKPQGMVNLRTSLIWGWNELNRTNLVDADKSASMVGWFNEMDWKKTTVAFDLVYVNADSTGHGIYSGLSAIQRIGIFNTTFRLLGSIPVGAETEHNQPGALAFGQVSWTPKGNHNFVYVNGFRGFDNFRSVSRDPAVGGPLTTAGILYAAPGLGRYDTPISSTPDDAWGGAIGYQIFSKNIRRQLQLEMGGRYSSSDATENAFGTGVRYQMAFGRRGVLQWDAFGLLGKDQNFAENSTIMVEFGGRFEVLVKL